MFDGMREGCGKTLEDSRKSLKQAGADLEKTLRKSKVGIECEITKAADEAASHEAPAWKMLVAILLIIVVIVIVVAVTILTAGAGLGLLAVIAIGAVVGAVTSGLITMATNLWTNQDVMQGVGEAMIMGAITGAAGGVIGMGVGAVVGKVAGTAISVAAKEIVTVILSTAIIDVGTQLYEGKGSLKNFSFKQLGFDLALALVMHKALGGGGHAEVEGPHPGAPAVEPPTVEPTARPAASEPAPVEPRPTEPTPKEPIPAEAKPTEAKPTEPAAAEAKPPEPPPAETKPTEAAPAEPAPTEPRPAEPTAPEATPAEAGPPSESKPGEAAPGETKEPGTPSEPAAPEELSPPGEALMSPQEKSVLDSTANKPSSELTPEEVRTEREVASRTQGEPIEDPPFTTEKELPNGHEIKETPDGELCERCSPACDMFDKNGKRIKGGRRPPKSIRDMDDATLAAEIENNKKAPGNDYADELRYERYKRGKGTMDFDEWRQSSRGGRPGGPEHQADVKANNGPPNNLEPRAVGNTVPDGVGARGQEVSIRGVKIKPKPNGRVLVESDRFVWDGKQLSAEARAQVEAMRAAAPNDTIVVTDQYDSNTPPMIFEPGQVPPASDIRVGPDVKSVQKIK
jgi:hypothetical protein